MLCLNSRTGFDLLTRYHRLADIRERPLTPKGGSPLPIPNGLRSASVSLAGRARQEGLSSDNHSWMSASDRTVSPNRVSSSAEGGSKTSEERRTTQDKNVLVPIPPLLERMGLPGDRGCEDPRLNYDVVETLQRLAPKLENHSPVIEAILRLIEETERGTLERTNYQ